MIGSTPTQVLGIKPTKYYKERRLFIMKTYKIYVNGNYVGSQELTPSEVSKINNDTTIILK